MQTANETAIRPPISKVISPPHATEGVSVLVLALATAQALRALIGLKLAPMGLASGQDRLLTVLAEKGPLSVSGLADELNVRPSTVSKMMDRLAARGYTRRVPDDLDARRINVELTDDGQDVCRKLQVLCEAIEAELQSDLSADDICHMRVGLDVLNHTVGKRLRRLR